MRSFFFEGFGLVQPGDVDRGETRGAPVALLTNGVGRPEPSTERERRETGGRQRRAAAAGSGTQDDERERVGGPLLLLPGRCALGLFF